MSADQKCDHTDGGASTWGYNGSGSERICTRCGEAQVYVEEPPSAAGWRTITGRGRLNDGLKKQEPMLGEVEYDET